MQKFGRDATKHNMEVQHAKNENKRLRTQLTELRDKMDDSDSRVSALLPRE